MVLQYILLIISIYFEIFHPRQNEKWHSPLIGYPTRSLQFACQLTAMKLETAVVQPEADGLSCAKRRYFLGNFRVFSAREFVRSANQYQTWKSIYLVNRFKNFLRLNVSSDREIQVFRPVKLFVIVSNGFTRRFLSKVSELSPGLVAVAGVSRIEQVDQGEVDDGWGVIF